MLNFGLSLEPDLLIASCTSKTLLNESLGNNFLILIILLTLPLEAWIYDLPLGLDFGFYDKLFL